MKAPKCRLCGKSHWGGCRAEKVAESVLEAGGDSEAGEPEGAEGEGVVCPACGTDLGARARERERRREYMREWRKRK